jgi:hypothetical protein
MFRFLAGVTLFCGLNGGIAACYHFRNWQPKQMSDLRLSVITSAGQATVASIAKQLISHQ